MSFDNNDRKSVRNGLIIALLVSAVAAISTASKQFAGQFGISEDWSLTFSFTVATVLFILLIIKYNNYIKSKK